MSTYLHYLLGIALVIFIPFISWTQNWETVYYQDFDSETSIDDIENLVLVGNQNTLLVSCPKDNGSYDKSVAFNVDTGSSSSDDTGIGFYTTLEEGYEYRILWDVVTYEGSDIRYMVGESLSNLTQVSGPHQTIVYNPLEGFKLKCYPGIAIISDPFVVSSGGSYNVVLLFDDPVQADSIYADGNFEKLDYFHLQRRALSPTTLSFSTWGQFTVEGASVDICVEISDPSATNPTSVEVDILDNVLPHFPDYEPVELVFPAGSSATECFELDIPLTATNFDEISYDFILSNPTGVHPVQIGTISYTEVVVEGLNQPGVFISSATNIDVTEGQNVDICITTTEAPTSNASVQLGVVGNSNPHFISLPTIDFVIPAGETEVCHSITIPFASEGDAVSYTFSLQNEQGVTLIDPNDLSINVTPYIDTSPCWAYEMSQDFNDGVKSNFSDLSNIISHGYSLGIYGATGTSSDLCAIDNQGYSSYIGLNVELEANEAYRLIWNAKGSDSVKEMNVFLGSDVANATEISGPYQIPIIPPTGLGTLITSESFFVETAGNYVIYLQKTPNSSFQGSIKVDELVLEKGCYAGPPIELSFSDSLITIEEGGETQICVQINNPHPTDVTTTEVALVGNQSPHLSDFSNQTLSFPGGSSTTQCFTLSTISSPLLDGDVSYSFELTNMLGQYPVEVISPSSLTLVVQDNSAPDNCMEWTAFLTEDFTGASPILDNLDHLVISGPGHFFLGSEGATGNGDPAVKGILQGDGYIGLSFHSDGNYEYRFKWKGMSDRLVQIWFGTGANTATPIGSSFTMTSEWQEFTSDFMPVEEAGDYVFLIKNLDTNNSPDYNKPVFFDDLVLERRCQPTSVYFSEASWEVIEGESTTICLDIDFPSAFQSTTALLKWTNGADPHFSGQGPFSVVFPAGNTQQQCFEINAIGNNIADNRTEYRLEIIEVSGGTSTIIGEQDRAKIKVIDDTSCWESGSTQDFSNTNIYLTNIPNLAQSGAFIRSNYGAQGIYGDFCAKGDIQDGDYIGFQEHLEADKVYRVVWNGKATSKAHQVQFLMGSTISGASPVGEPGTIPVISNNQLGADLDFEYFTVPTTGKYFLLLASQNEERGSVRLDYFRLEERCPNTQLFFSQDFIAAEEGLPVEVCVDIMNPSTEHPTSVEIAFTGNQIPHFAGSAAQTVTFPANSTTQQCVTFYSSANELSDDNLSYQLILRNASGGFMANILEPDLVKITLEDDTKFDSCAWAGPDVEICSGEQVQLGINYADSLNLSDCFDEDYCFKWFPETGILNNDYYSQQPMVAPDETTLYTVIMTDGYGNVFTDEVLVTVHPSVEINLTPEEPAICLGDMIQLSVEHIAGSGNYAYSWSEGSTQQSIQVSSPGNYTVSVADLNTTCSAVGNIEVASLDMPYNIVSNVPILCAENPVATLELNGIGGTEQLLYSWSTGAITKTITTSIAGEYAVTITNEATQCSGVFEYTLEDLSGVELSISFTKPHICEDDEVTLIASLEGYADESGNPISYLWSTGSTSPSSLVNSAGTYSVTVTLASGCIITATETLPAANIEVEITSDQPFACPDQLTTLTANSSVLASGSLLWSTGQITSTIYVDEAGTYSVTLTDTYGCTAENAIEIAACPPPITATEVYFADYDYPSPLVATEGESMTICIAIDNPSATTATTFELTGAESPHFTNFAPMELSFPAGSDVPICVNVPIPVVANANDPENYTFNIDNVSGGIDAQEGENNHLQVQVEKIIDEGCFSTIYFEDFANAVALDLSDVPNLVYSGQFDLKVLGATGTVFDTCASGKRIANDRQIGFNQYLEGGETYRVSWNVKTRYADKVVDILVGTDFANATVVSEGHILPLKLNSEPGVDITSDTFSVQTSGDYVIFIQGSPDHTIWDGRSRFDNFLLEKACPPTALSFTTENASVFAGNSIEVCVDITNPSETEATTVVVDFTEDASLHFPDFNPVTLTFPAGSTDNQCFTLTPSSEPTEIQTTYHLALNDVAGGYYATTQAPETLELLVSNDVIRCQVSVEDLEYVCGADNTVILSDVPLITHMDVGDSFLAGDFKVEVTEIRGNDYFNGKGKIVIPYVEYIHVDVEIINIRVNENCQMVEGEVEVIGVTSPVVADILNTLEDLDEVLDVISEVFEVINEAIGASDELNNVLSDDWNVLEGSGPIEEEYPYLPSSVLDQLDDALLCYLYNIPNFEECNEQLNQAVDDLVAAINELFEADYAIHFKAFPEQEYGFDELQHAEMQEHYNQLTVAGSIYDVPWKSVLAQTGADNVLLTIPYSELPADLTFENNDKEIIPYFNYNGEVQLVVNGLEDEETYQIYPVQTKEDEDGNEVKKYAGKLNVISYEELEEEVEVVLVPVNGVISISEEERIEIESFLRNTYKGAVASAINVTVNDNLDIPDDFDNVLDTTGSAFYTVYNPEMLRINRAFRQAYDYDRNKNYVFLAQSSEGNLMAGFMPRGKPFGYAISSLHTSTADLSETIAHELGHGVFKLRHTFEEFSIASYSTNHLMDYSEGSHLSKYEWDIIHNPGLAIPLFDSDTEAALLATTLLDNSGASLPPSSSPGWHDYDPACPVYKIYSGRTVTIAGASTNDRIYIEPETEFLKYVKRGEQGYKLYKQTYRYADPSRTTVVERDIPLFPLFANIANSTATNFPHANSGESIPIIIPSGTIEVNAANCAEGAGLNVRAIDETTGAITCEASDCGIVVDLTGSNFNISNLSDFVHRINAQYQTNGESGELLTKVYISNTEDDEQRGLVLEYISSRPSDEVTLWVELSFSDGVVSALSENTGYYLGYQKIGGGAPIEGEYYTFLSLFNSTMTRFSGYLSATITTATDPIAYLLDALEKGISSIDVPERFYNYTHEEYNPILFYVFEFLIENGPHSNITEWQEDIIRDFWETNFSAPDDPPFPEDRLNELRFAFLCGMIDEVFNTIAGISGFLELMVRSADEVATAPFDLLAFLTDEDTNIRELVTAEQFEEAKEMGLSFANQIWTELEDLHDPNKPFRLAHTLGRDAVFVLSFFVGAGELRMIATIAGNAARQATLKLGSRLAKLKFIRYVRSTGVQLACVIALSTTSPYARAMDRMLGGFGDEVIEFVMKPGVSHGDDVYPGLAGAFAHVDAPATKVIDGKVYGKVRSGPTKQIQVKNHNLDIIQKPQDFVNEFRAHEYRALNQSPLSEGPPFFLISHPPQNGEQPDDGDCEVCQSEVANRPMDIVEQMERICDNALGTSIATFGLNKLCYATGTVDDNLSDDDLREVLNTLETWNATLLNLFFEDISVYLPEDNHIANNISSLNGDMTSAWEHLKTLLPEDLKHFATDLDHLKFLQSKDVQKSLDFIEERQIHLFVEYPNLTPGEIIALNHFTTEQGFQINFWLREKEVTGVQLWNDEFANIFLGFMDSAFGKLPNYNLPVFIRIEGGNSSDFALNRESFMSFAKSNFSSFIHGARSNKTETVETYIIKLTSSSNKIIDMEPFSQVPLEKEVLVYRDINLNINSINYEQFPCPTPEEIITNAPDDFDITFEEARKLYETQLNQWAGNTTNPNRLNFEYDYDPSLSLDEEHSFFEQKVQDLLGENAYETDAYQNAILIKTIYVNGN